MFTNISNNKNQKYFMRLALQQAKINLGNTNNNPSVGCVIVKNNNIISIGRTAFKGVPHAEKNAITSCKEQLTNSTLYSTLEPCVHFGKTPPCINLIKLKKIKRVFFSLKDPDIRTFNKSKKILQKHRIKVSGGILLNQSNKFYKSYIKTKNGSLPFVTAKIAISKDLFTVSKKTKWITNEYSRARVHLMRSEHDCIITTYQTVIKDNPMLNCRIKGLENRSPDRVIIDKNLKTPINSKIIKSSSKYNTIIFYTNSNTKKINVFKKMKVKLIKIDTNLNDHFDLQKILLVLKKIGYSRIFLESGINLFNSFLIKKLVDEIQIFVSSKKINKSGSSKINNYVKLLLKKKSLTINVNLFGDKLKSYRVK